jgi:hypothetical protein
MTEVQAGPCPTPAALREFSAGRISPRECELISQHVSRCPRCLSRLREWDRDADEVVQALRKREGNEAAPPWEGEREVRSMVARLRASRPFAATAGRPADDPHVAGEADTAAPNEGDATSRVGRDETDRTVEARERETLPREFGRYLLLRRLGDGGMGSVYLARDTQLEREVALKIPQRFVRDSRTELQRFLREARAAAAIVHPHLCPIYDVGELEGTPFLTMQHVAGGSLTERLKRSWRPSPQEAAELVQRVAQGLAAAHARGVIHRDVKSANILLTEQGVPLLSDFGLARRLVPGDAELSREGQVVGTPGYMAPEQARGDGDAIGPAADVYGLGVVLYELLTGRRPFIGTTTEVLAAVLHQSTPPPSSLSRDLDGELERIVLKALAKPISERWGSMEEFAGELGRYVERGKTAPRDRRGSWWRGAVAVAVVGTAAAGIVVERQRRERPAPSTGVALPSAGESQDTQAGSEHNRPSVAGASGSQASAAKSIDAATSGDDFAITLNGLADEGTLRPVRSVSAWKSMTAFAEPSTIDTLEYPTLPVTRFAFETEIEFREPGRSVEYRFVDRDYRLWLRLQWVPERNSYRAILQRYHKTGSWVIGQYFFATGERLSLRLVVCDGMSQLFRGEELILANPTIAARRALHIAAFGDLAGGVMIHSCRFRPLTSEEVKRAEEANQRAAEKP